MTVIDQILVFMSFFIIGFFLFDLLNRKLAMLQYEKEMREIEENYKIEKKNRKIYTFDDFKK